MAQYLLADEIPRGFKLRPEDLKEFRGLLERNLGRPLFETEEQLQEMAKNLMQVVWLIARHRRMTNLGAEEKPILRNGRG